MKLNLTVIYKIKFKYFLQKHSNVRFHTGLKEDTMWSRICVFRKVFQLLVAETNKY